MLHILILITLCSTSLNAMRMPEYEKQSVTQNPLITLTAQLIKKDTAGNYSNSSSTFNINRNGDCNALELGKEDQFIALQSPVAFIKKYDAISFTLQYILLDNNESKEQKTENVTLPLEDRLTIVKPVPREIYNRDDLYVRIDTNLDATNNIPFTPSMNNTKPVDVKKIALMLRLIKENRDEKYQQCYHCKVMCSAAEKNEMKITAQHRQYDIDNASDYPDGDPLDIASPITFDPYAKLISTRIRYRTPENDNSTTLRMSTNKIVIPLGWNSSMELIPGVYVRIDAHEEK